MSPEGWYEQPVGPTQLPPWPGPPSQPPRVFMTRDRLTAILSRDEIEPGDLRWHISLRHEDRVPTWDELARCGHELRPGVPFCIGVPPRSWWINVHEHVLHLWELKDGPILEQWKHERLGMDPT